MHCNKARHCAAVKARPRGTEFSTHPGTQALGNARHTLPHVQYIANKTTALATNRNEVISPANIFQPRTFVIAAAVSTRSASSLLFASAAGPVASACIRGGASPATAPFRAAPEGGDGNKSPALPFPCTAIGALRFRGRGGRLFFMA